MLVKVILALALQVLGGIQVESVPTDIQSISCTCEGTNNVAIEANHM